VKHPAKDCTVTVSDRDDSVEAKEIHEQLGREIENDIRQVANRQPFMASVTDPAGVFHGGIRGYSHWNWLYISHLWVQAEYRTGGLGAQLLLHAEHEAKSRKLTGVYVDTFSDKARKFYVIHGYVELGRINDFPPGNTRYFLSKTL
jgi:GNAT superfamily N-acetyltransferase